MADTNSDRLLTLFQQKRDLKKTFEDRKKREWDETVATLESELDNLIAQLVKDNALTTAALGRAMGTSDFRTAKARMVQALKSQGSVEPLTPEDGTPSNLALTWERDYIDEGLWTVSNGTSTLGVVVIPEEQALAVVAPSDDLEFDKLFTDSPEGAYLLWQQQTGN